MGEVPFVSNLLWRAKFNRWNRKKLRKLDQADIVMLRYPKSGVTWLRVMITQIFRTRLGLPPSHLIGSNEFEALAPSAPKAFIAMDNIGIPRDELKARCAGKAVVILLRDPRDVAVSLYFHFAKRSTPLERMAFGIPADVERNGIFAFVMNESYGLPQIIDFMNYWSRALAEAPHAAVLRYEDLKADPDAGLRRVMDIVSPGTTPEEIGAAVQFAAFDKMKAMEAQGSFGVDILKATDASDQDSFKVRRGKVGGYVDYFSASELEAIEDLVQRRLDPELGYGRGTAPAPESA